MVPPFYQFLSKVPSKGSAQKAIHRLCIAIPTLVADVQWRQPWSGAAALKANVQHPVVAARAMPQASQPKKQANGWHTPCFFPNMLCLCVLADREAVYKNGFAVQYLFACLQTPRLAPSAGVKLCTYHRWFGRPQNAACPSYWESPMPSCTGFSGFAWGLITSQLRRAAISTCLGPVVSATCAILMH